MAITGNATTQAGAAADLVRIFRWPDNSLETTSVPDAAGDWAAEVSASGDYGVTYIANGCQPITNGPYYVESTIDEYWSNVVSLLHFDDDIIDEAGILWTPVGTPVFAPGKFGSGIEFDGTGRYLKAPHSEDLEFSSGDFTLEAWLYLPVAADSSKTIIDKWGASSNRSGSWFWSVSGSGFLLGMRDAGNNYAEVSTASTVLPTLEWFHAAVVRYRDEFTFFLNGVSVHSEIKRLTIRSGQQELKIGFTDAGPGFRFNGVIDDLRVTKGIARYTSDFIPKGHPSRDR